MQGTALVIVFDSGRMDVLGDVEVLRVEAGIIGHFGCTDNAVLRAVAAMIRLVELGHGLCTSSTGFVLQLFVRIVWCDLRVESLEPVEQAAGAVEVQRVQKTLPLTALKFARPALPRLALERTVEGPAGASPQIEWTRRVPEIREQVTVCILLPLLVQIVKCKISSKCVACRSLPAGACRCQRARLVHSVEANIVKCSPTGGTGETPLAL